MAKILITGSKSFIGSNYIRYSKNKEFRKVSLVETIPCEIDFKEIDVVLHLAAIVHQSKKISEQEYFRVNTDMCLAVAEYAKRAGVRQFVFMSSVKVYGAHVKGSEKVRNEHSECYPDDAYGKSKYAAEVRLMKMQEEKFTVSIIRTPLVYGEGVKANFNNLIRLIDKFPLLPLGNVNNKRNFTFTENLTGFIDRIIEKEAHGIFIAMDNNTTSTTELVNYISGFLEKKVYLFKIPRFVLHIIEVLFPVNFERLFGSLEFDNCNTKRILGYEPPFSTEDGIKKTVGHYMQQKMLHRS